jgi:hypothetical protein
MGLKEVTIEKTDDIVIFKIPVLTLHSKESFVVQNSNASNKDLLQPFSAFMAYSLFLRAFNCI